MFKLQYVFSFEEMNMLYVGSAMFVRLLKLHDGITFSMPQV